MTCRDFQRKWDELLDADGRTAPMPVGPARVHRENLGSRPWLDHAAGCPDCRQLAARYHVLRQATRAWRQPPVPSADLADRILAAAEVSTIIRMAGLRGPRARVGRGRFLWRSDRRVAAAAVLAAILLPTISRMIGRTHDVRPANPPAIAALEPDHDLHAVSSSDVPPVERPALNRALAEATSATWDLARSASEPAARISRDMLDASTQSGDGLVRALNRRESGQPGIVPLWGRWASR